MIGPIQLTGTQVHLLIDLLGYVSSVYGVDHDAQHVALQFVELLGGQRSLYVGDGRGRNLTTRQMLKQLRAMAKQCNASGQLPGPELSEQPDGRLEPDPDDQREERREAREHRDAGLWDT